jgi:hypothetical protein
MKQIQNKQKPDQNLNLPMELKNLHHEPKVQDFCQMLLDCQKEI